MRDFQQEINELNNKQAPLKKIQNTRKLTDKENLKLQALVKQEKTLYRLLKFQDKHFFYI